MELYKVPGVSETLDWVAALIALDGDGARCRGARAHAWRRAQGEGRHRRGSRRTARGDAGPRRGSLIRVEHSSISCSSSAASCGRSASTSTSVACSMPPKRCCTWTSAGATTCITRYGRSSCIVTKTSRLFDRAFEAFWKADSNRSARHGARREHCGPPGAATGRPLMPNAGAHRRLRRRATPRQRERSGLEQCRNALRQRLFGLHCRRDRARARGSRSPRVAARAAPDAPVDSRPSVHAWTSGAPWHEAFARAVIRSRFRDSGVARSRVRSSSCAMSADRWNATRACCCTSSTHLAPAPARRGVPVLDASDADHPSAAQRAPRRCRDGGRTGRAGLVRRHANRRAPCGSFTSAGAVACCAAVQSSSSSPTDGTAAIQRTARRDGAPQAELPPVVWLNPLIGTPTTPR